MHLGLLLEMIVSIALQALRIVSFGCRFTVDLL